MAAIPPFFKAGEPFARPSHPTPSTALKPPCSLPLRTHRPPRPQLRIITDPGSFYVGVRKPIAIRHPALIKSAPLVVARNTGPIISHQATYNQQPDVSPRRLATLLLDCSGQPTCVLPNTAKPRVRPGARPRLSGRTRRLSDKFKNLFAALHIRKEDRIPFFQPEQYGFHHSGGDENAARKAFPARPHRSPGTASFLVSRRHLAPDPDMPISASTSSTVFSMASRRSCGEKTGPYLDRYLSLEVSHFSDPNTLASAGGVSESGWSVSSGEVLERSPAIQERLNLDAGTAVQARVGRVLSTRRVLSMPDVRVLGATL